jgi:hypothetical protein
MEETFDKEKVEKMFNEYSQKINELEKRGHQILERHLKEIDEEKIKLLREKLRLK